MRSFLGLSVPAFFTALALFPAVAHAQETAETPPMPAPVEASPAPALTPPVTPSPWVASAPLTDAMPSPAPTPSRTSVSPLVVMSMGYTMGAFHHPDVTSHSYSGPMVTAAAGVAIGTKMSLMVELATFEMRVIRNDHGTYDAASSAISSQVHTQAAMTNAPAPAVGGVIGQTPLHFHTLGPRFDWAPLGLTGPFIGATVGAAITADLGTKIGGAAAARVGYAWHPVDVLGLSAEAGAHGQLYGDASAALPYVSVNLELLLTKPSKTL